MVANLGRALATVLLALFAPTSVFADDAAAERVIATYGKLDSYCDTVAVVDQEVASEYRRCYTRDGRYKRSEQLAPPSSQRRLNWGDNARTYSWYTNGLFSTIHYGEETAHGPFAGAPPEGLTARALSPFLRHADTERRVREILREMEIVEDSSATIILQRQHTSPTSTTHVVNRLWVRRSDGIVTRGEETWDGQIVWSATLVEARVNAPLSQADLSETVPFFQRYNLSTPLRAFVSGIVVPAFVTGLVLSVLWRRPRNWGRIWRVYAIGIGIGSAIFAAFTAISLLPWGRSGHPPAIFLVIILGAFAAKGVLVLAALMLGIYLGDLGRRMVSDAG